MLFSFPYSVFAALRMGMSVAFHHEELGVAVHVGALQLLKRPIAFTAERIHIGTLEDPAE